MKKIVFVISLLTVITSFTFQCHAYEAPIKQPSKIESVKTIENSKEIIYRDVITSLLVPHNTVGDERIIIETGGLGSVEIKKFEHIKSYELPWNWQHIIKKIY